MFFFLDVGIKESEQLPNRVLFSKGIHIRAFSVLGVFVLVFSVYTKPDTCK